MKKKDNSIAFIKCIMMIMVVLCHSCIFFTNNWFTIQTPIYSSKLLSFFSMWLGTFHTQTFCMASGFLFYYLKKYNIKNINKGIEILKRAKRLLLPYLCTSIFWVIPISIYFFKYNLNDILKKYLLMESPSQLWFLIMLFFVFILFYLLLNKIKISFKNLIIMYFVCVLLSLLTSKFHIVYFQIPKVIQYCLYFYFGGFIFENKENIKIKHIIIETIMILLISLMYLYMNIYDLSIYKYIYTLTIPLVSLLEITIIYYLCNYTIKKYEDIIIKSKTYIVLEKNSFGIYLFHQQIIYFIIVLLNGVVNPFVQVLASFIISLTISLFISILLEKNRITKTMFGL